jgi:hypothetical protein
MLPGLLDRLVDKIRQIDHPTFKFRSLNVFLHQRKLFHKMTVGVFLLGCVFWSYSSAVTIGNLVELNWITMYDDGYPIENDYAYQYIIENFEPGTFVYVGNTLMDPIKTQVWLNDYLLSNQSEATNRFQEANSSYEYYLQFVDYLYNGEKKLDTYYTYAVQSGINSTSDVPRIILLQKYYFQQLIEFMDADYRFDLLWASEEFTNHLGEFPCQTVIFAVL